MNYRCVFYMLKLCVLVGLDWAEPMIFLLLHVTCSCIFMHTYPCFYLIDIDLCWYFSACLCFSLSLSRLVCNMAPNRKSTPSWNPLHSGASSSDCTPSHVQFRDEKARKDFLENFS